MLCCGGGGSDITLTLCICRPRTPSARPPSPLTSAHSSAPRSYNAVASAESLKSSEMAPPSVVPCVCLSRVPQPVCARNGRCLRDSAFLIPHPRPTLKNGPGPPLRPGWVHPIQRCLCRFHPWGPSWRQEPPGEALFVFATRVQSVP